MARLKLSKASTYLAYSQRKLDEAKTDEDRRFWQGKVVFYAAALKDRCQRCGRLLEDETSKARGYGSECIRKVAEARAS